MDTKVNLLIIGAQKAGTTSLYEYLKQHSEIYFSEIKEVTYFVDDELYQKGEAYYHSFFSKFKNESIIASAYVHMLPTKKAPKRVFDYNPNMKFIVMTRDPIERAYSAYNYAIKNGWEDENNSFMSTLKLEQKRIKEQKFDLTYFYNGLYNKHLNHWQRIFPKKNFLVLKDTDLKSNPKETLHKIFDFLNIEDESYNIDFSKEYNKAGKVRFKSLQKFLLSKNSKIKKTSGKLFPPKTRVWIRAKILSRIYSFNQVEKSNDKLDPKIIANLKEYFKNEVTNSDKT